MFTTKKFDERTATDDELREHFEESQYLQDRFTGPEAYIAYVRNQRTRDLFDTQTEKIASLEGQIQAKKAAIKIRRWLAMTPEQLRGEFRSSRELQAEFSSGESFVAFVKAEERRSSIPAALLI